MNEKDYYVIVFKSGQVQTRKNTDEFKLIPKQSVECFLFARYDHTFRGPSNTTDWFQFYFVDTEGNPATYTLGRFEVTYLGLDDGCTNFFGRAVTIHDTSSDKYYEYKSTCRNCFIPEEIKPLLEKLNGCNDEEEIINTLGLHKPYQDLQYLYDSLQESYNQLKKDHDELKTRFIQLETALSEIRVALDKVK